MRENKANTAKVDRRSFLRTASLALGTAGAAATVGSVEAIAKPDETNGEAAGYRETEHVRTYYKLAQF